MLTKTIKELYEMRTCTADHQNSLIIPHFQRGLVWNPKQITDLWDSISKGYPIGAFMCLPASNHTDQGEGHQGYYLMDGQQRCNAICIGINDGTKSNEEPLATLWVDWDELEKPKFMVCTPRHPWGFRWGENELTRFPADQMHKANLLFKKKSEKEDFEERYKIASLKEGWPFDHLSFKHPIPVPYLLQEYQPTEKYEGLLNRQSAFYAPSPLLKYLDEINHDSNIKNTLIERFKSALGSNWRKRILKLEIPLIIIQSDQLSDSAGTSNVDRVEELFSRINNGGSPISSLDAIYSHITAYWGDIKKINEDIAEGFMPANRLISIAGRLAKANVHALDKETCNKTSEYTSPLHHRELIQWKKEENTLACQKFKKLYQSSEGDFKTTPLYKIKEKFQELTKDIPPYIYLKDNDEWLFIIVMILDLFLNKKKEKDEIPKNHFVQLCMLPYVLSAATSSVSREYFCRAFYKVILHPPTPFNLEEIMIRGVILSSVHELTFMYPILSSSDDDLTFPSQLDFYNESTSAYKNYWWQNFFKYTGTGDNPLLCFYLKNYINKMNFNPALRSSWDGALNRPWDMDHIVPQSWWKENSGEQHFAGNMQPLHFSDNRSKRDSCIGINKRKDLNDEQLLGILRYDEWESAPFIGTNKNECGLSNNKDYMDKVSFPRFKAMVSSIYRDLKLKEFICSINDKIPPMEEKLTANVTKRYNLFLKVHDWLREQYSDRQIKWGAVIYEWKQQKKSVRDTIMVPLSESEEPPSFYESLTPWLSVGIKTQDVYVCVCASGETYEIGIRRLFGDAKMDPQIRQKIDPSDHNSWWYAVKTLLPKEQTQDQLLERILKELKTFLDAL